MDRDNIIILRQPGLSAISDQYEAWGSLTDLCKHHKEFSYSYLKRLKFPYVYKGFMFVKVPYRKKTIK